MFQLMVVIFQLMVVLFELLGCVLKIMDLNKMGRDKIRVHIKIMVLSVFKMLVLFKYWSIVFIHHTAHGGVCFGLLVRDVYSWACLVHVALFYIGLVQFYSGLV